LKSAKLSGFNGVFVPAEVMTVGVDEAVEVLRAVDVPGS
jgi:hypothetical protein